MDPGDITRELIAMRGQDDRVATDRLFGMVYERLHRIAHGRLRRAGTGHTLDTTGLVHEAYLKFVDHRKVELRDREHFFAVAARAMRQILVDHVRGRNAVKRGGDLERTALDETRIGVGADVVALLDLDAALDDLAAVSARLGRVVELKYFAGLSFGEIASVLDVTERTVQRDWRKARAFLHDALGRDR